MAQRIQTLYIDDLDGSDATGTVRFGLDGAAYEIDLNDKHAEALRGVLAKYVEHARRASAGSAAARTARALDTSRAGRKAGSGARSEQREYLKLLGHEMKDRGRIPAHLDAIIVPPRDQWPMPAGVTAAEPPRMPARNEVEEAARDAAETAAAAADAILAESAPAAGAKSDQGMRDKAILLVREGGSVASVARDIGVSATSLRKWIKAADAQGIESKGK